MRWTAARCHEGRCRCDRSSAGALRVGRRHAYLGTPDVHRDRQTVHVGGRESVRLRNSRREEKKERVALTRPSRDSGLLGISGGKRLCCIPRFLACILLFLWSFISGGVVVFLFVCLVPWALVVRCVGIPSLLILFSYITSRLHEGMRCEQQRIPSSRILALCRVHIRSVHQR